MSARCACLRAAGRPRAAATSPRAAQAHRVAACRWRRCCAARLWWMPLNLANPAWVDAEPDLKQHIVEIALPASARCGSGMAELDAAGIEALHPVLLDRKRPLWKMHCFEGLAPSSRRQQARRPSTPSSTTPRSTARRRWRWPTSCSTSRPSRARSNSRRVEAAEDLPPRDVADSCAGCSRQPGAEVAEIVERGLPPRPSAR